MSIERAVVIFIFVLLAIVVIAVLLHIIGVLL